MLTKDRTKMTSKQRKTTLFRRRIVIALPDWSVFVVAGAVGFALLDKPLLVTNIIALVLVVIATSCVWVARKQVRALRYDVHEALNNINNDDDELNHHLEDFDPEEVKTFRVKKINGERSSRVSE